MHNYFLRSTSLNAINFALKKAGLLEELDFGDGSIMILPRRDVYISHIGPHIIEHPKVDENNNLIQDAIMDQRWHTNIRLSIPLTDDQKAILPLIDPAPSTPSYMFG